MSPFKFWTLWLVVSGFTLSAFGVLMVLFIGTPLFAGLNGQIDRAFWPSSLAVSGLQEYQQWVYGVWGATVAGFGLLAALVGGNAFARRETWARNAIAGSLLFWYVMDTIISLNWHVWVNAALNTGVLALFALPLACTWQLFKRGATETF